MCFSEPPWPADDICSHDKKHDESMRTDPCEQLQELCNGAFDFAIEATWQTQEH